MRKLALRLSLALLTFVGGVLVSTVWSIFPPIVSLCQLAAQPSRYEGKTIRVKGTASALDVGFLLYDCHCRQAARIVFEDDRLETAEVKSLHSELLLGTSDIGRTEAEVVVSGRFEAFTCTPTFEIVASRVKQIAPGYTLVLRSD